MIRWQECARRHAAPENSQAMLNGFCGVRIRSVAQSGAVGVEASIWIASYLLAILGLVKAVYSEQPLLWLAVWPVPVALASTILIFLRQGFHFRNGVLVLGRRRG